MRLINKLLMLGIISITAFTLNSRAFSAGAYNMSCTNTAYDASLNTSLYAQASAGTDGTLMVYGVYTGTDCIYSGGGRTNSSAIVGGGNCRIYTKAATFNLS
jgi:hypothetical protein